MIKIGNFFFKYTNFLFVFLYLLLFIPSPLLFHPAYFGLGYWHWPIIIGLIITVSGQLIRGATIGLSYIIRGGKDRKIHAEQLVTNGIFNHCRNPLYFGNILMLLGVGILSNSLIYIALVMPLFFLIYHTIVLAEENFLQHKFSGAFIDYCKKVNRWLASITGLTDTFNSMNFSWRRWILKEYNTQYVWLSGITLILLLKYPQLTQSVQLRNKLLIIILSGLLSLYLFVRFQKKSNRLKE
jgi:protein-S-isoprenylcysteine O-methyltransferase Ste14